MERDKSYDLDASFASRGEGEILNLRTPRTRVMRTPGVDVISANEDPRMGVPADVDLDRDEDDYAPGMAGLGMQIPGFGEVNVLQAAAFLSVGALIAFLIIKRKKR